MRHKLIRVVKNHRKLLTNVSEDKGVVKELNVR